MQNLVVVSHTVCAHVGGLKNLGPLGPQPLERGVADPQRARYSSTCDTVPNFVAYRLNRLGGVGSQKFRGYWGHAPVGCGRGCPSSLEICFSPTHVTVPNSVILCQTVRA